jgi:hypothetical protein
MFRRKWLTAGAALGLGGLAAALLPVLPALGQESPPSKAMILGSPVKITARGAAAKPWAYVACPRGTIGDVGLSLSERSGNGIASGSNEESFYCSGEIQTITLTVQASNRPFVPGVASELGFLSYCTQTKCSQVEPSKNVKLIRDRS